jgi:hypothetical protein
MTRQSPVQHREQLGAQISGTVAYAIPAKRRRRAALCLGTAVWVIVFAAIFTPFYLLLDGLPTILVYLGLWVLPQVVSSMAGAFALATALRTPPRAGTYGATFAVVTSSITAFVGVLTLFLVMHDMPSGNKLVGLFILAYLLVLGFDGLVATIGGHLAGRAAWRLVVSRREPGGMPPE